MTSTISILRAIQNIDLEIGKVESEGSSCKEGINNATVDIEKLTGEIEALEAEFSEVDTLVKDLNEEVRASKEKITKDETRLGEVTNDKAYKALTKEINTAKRVIKTAGERLEKIKPGADEKKAVIEAKKSLQEEKALEIEKLTEELESRSVEWKEQIDAMMVERADVIKDLNPSILKRYEKIKSRRGGQGLAKVYNETCQGCYIHIPPQVYIVLMKGPDDLIPCPNCHRILYFQEESAQE